MAEFLVELYVPRADAAAVTRGAERTRRVAEAMTLDGTPVRYLQSIFVPDDETCFFLYEAVSADAARRAALGAALTVDRVAEAVAERDRTSVV